MTAKAMAHDLRAYADWCIAHYEDVPPTIVNDLNAAAAMIEQMEVELAAMRTAARSLKMALDKQNQRSRWVSVAEQLPAETGVYIVNVHQESDNESGDCVLTAWYQVEKPIFSHSSIGWSLLNEFYPFSNQLRDDITHWMPWPEAPEVE